MYLIIREIPFLYVLLFNFVPVFDGIDNGECGGRQFYSSKLCKLTRHLIANPRSYASHANDATTTTTTTTTTMMMMIAIEIL